MDLLPPAHLRSVLLDALALLISRQGFETFVRAPILEPQSAHFPDVWEPNARGVRLLSLRLLAYAGLGDLDASVELYTDGPETSAAPNPHGPEGAAAWFADIVDGTCMFGAEKKQLGEADAIVGTMCHEIAHAYRRHHGIEATTSRIDEEQTDMTTIYLGFGVLTVNNTHRYRTSGDAMVMRWSTSQVGYLPPQTMAFLFAAQCVARGLSAAERSRLAKLLETNQRACFEEACRELDADVHALRARLGVPPVEVWPPEEPFELPELREDAQFDPVGEREVWRQEFARFNEGRNVFRIAHGKGPFFGAIGAIALAVGGAGCLALRSIRRHRRARRGGVRLARRRGDRAA
jgi:hypothetical protein